MRGELLAQVLEGLFGAVAVEDLLVGLQVARGHEHRAHESEFAQRLMAVLRLYVPELRVVAFRIARIVGHRAGAEVPLGRALARVVLAVSRWVARVGANGVGKWFAVDQRATRIG